MKLHSLNPNFYIHVSGSDLYIPTIGLISLYSCIAWENSQLNRMSGGEGREQLLTHCLAAVPYLSLRSCGWAKSSHKWPIPIWKIMDHKWKQLILVVNFLFGFRVNEILNKTFILESDRLFICGVYLNSHNTFCKFAVRGEGHGLL